MLSLPLKILFSVKFLIQYFWGVIVALLPSLSKLHIKNIFIWMLTYSYNLNKKYIQRIHCWEICVILIRKCHNKMFTMENEKSWAFQGWRMGHLPLGTAIFLWMFMNYSTGKWMMGYKNFVSMSLFSDSLWWSYSCVTVNTAELELFLPH